MVYTAIEVTQLRAVYGSPCGFGTKVACKRRVSCRLDAKEQNKSPNSLRPEGEWTGPRSLASDSFVRQCTKDSYRKAHELVSCVEQEPLKKLKHWLSPGVPFSRS